MAARGKQIDVTVKYIPDVAALKNITAGMQDIKINVGNGKSIKRELTQPVQDAMKAVNKALSQGADDKTLLKLFQDVSKAAENAELKARSMINSINTSFSSAGNQNLLKQLKEYENEIERLKKESSNWDKKYGNKTLTSMRDNLGFNRATDARKELSSLEKAQQIGQTLTDQQQAQLALLKEYVNTLDERNRLAKQGITKGSIESQISNVEAKRDNILKTVQTSTQNAEAIKGISSLSTYFNEAGKIGTEGMNSVTQSINKTAEAAKNAQKEARNLGDVFTGTFLGTSISNIFEEAIQRGIQFFKEYDDTLTRTMMVTGMARDEVNALTESYNDLANQLSSTTKDVAAAQLIFYQQGLGTQEALEMTRASIAISKTGGIEAAEAADRLTAAIRGYQLSATEAMDIADKMSALDAAAASSVDELTVAMQKSASQARMAGLDLDSYMAYLSTMQEVTREAPENIGTAMKSITSRIQEITDIGKVEEDGTTFSNVAKALNSIGIAALDAQGQLRPLQEIMDELGPKWQTLDRNHQAYIATVLAGNRQQSRFIALMDNYDRALELTTISQNASGESAKQLRAYETGLEASLVGLSNAWQQLATKLADSSMISDAVDLLTSLLEIITAIPEPVIKMGAAFIALNRGLKILDTLKKGNLKESLYNFISPVDKDTNTRYNIFTTMKGQVEDLRNSVSQLGQTLTQAFNNIKTDGLFGGLKKTYQEIANLNTSVKDTETSLNAVSAAGMQANTSQSGLYAVIAAQGAATENYKNEAEQAAISTNQLKESNDAVKKSFDDDNSSMSKQTAELYNIGSAGEAASKGLRSVKEGNTEAQGYLESLGTRPLESLTQEELVRRRNLNLAALAEYDTAAEKFQISEMEKYFERNPQKYKTIRQQQGKLKKKNANSKQLSIFGDDFDEEEVVRKIAPDLVEQLESIKAAKEESKVPLLEENDLIDSILGIRTENAQAIEKNTQAIRQETQNIVTGVKGSGKLTKETSMGPITSFGNFESITGGKFKLVKPKSSGTLKSLGGKALSGLSKAGGAAFAGLAAGSIAQMAGEMLGLNEELSQGIGNMVGFTAAGAKFGIWGAVAGAAIGAVVTAFDALTVSAEEARKKLEEINEKQDALTTRSETISGALSTYEELSTKIGKTEEEQQELNSAAAQLAEAIPGAIQGYDNLGNAIINTAAAQSELNKIQNDQVKLAKNEMKTLGQLQEAEDGWDFTRGLLEIFTPGGKSAEQKQLEDRVGVAEEYRAEITEYFSTVTDSFTKELNDEQKELFENIANGFQQSLNQKIFSTDLSENIDIDEAASEYNELLNSLASSVNLEDLSTKMREIEFIFENGEHSLEEASQVARERLVGILSAAGYDSEEIDQIVNVVLNMTVDGAGGVISAMQDIEEDISDLEDKKEKGEISSYESQRLENLKYIQDQMNSADIEITSLISSLGLLNEQSISAIQELGGFEKIADMARDENGQINIGNNYMELRNKLLGERNRLEAERDSLNKKTPTLDDMSIGATEYVSQQEGHTGPAGLTTWDSHYGDAMEALFKATGGQSIGSLKDVEKQLGENWWSENTMLHGEKQWKEALEMYNGWLKTSDVAKELQEKTKGLTSIDTALGKLVPKEIQEYSFGDMKEQLDATISTWSELYDTINAIDEQGGEVSANNLSSIFGILDGLEQQMLNGAFDTEVWASNMDTLANSFSMVNGELTMTTQGQAALINLQEESTRASYRKMLADLEATESQLTNQKTLLQAYRAALVSTLNNLESEKDAKYSETDTEKQMASSLGEYLAGQEWAQVQVTQDSLNEKLQLYSDFFTEIKNMQIAAANGEDITWSDVQSNYKNQYNKIISSVEDRYKKSIITADRDETIANLKNEIANVDGAIAAIDQQLNTIQVKKKLAEYLASASTDYGKFVNKEKEDAEDAADAQEDYNEQLERTLTLIEKIQGLQHTMDENKNFMDLYDNYNGTEYAKLMVQNLDLAKQQYDVYKDLFEMQQQMTDQAAGDLLDSPYGSMFQIQENGDIGWSSDAMYDKYKGLPDEMQEDIDNLVQAFQEQRDALRDTELELVNYANALKEAQQAVVDLTIEAENTIVDALKNRESIMHEARKKALEDEIDMIEKAVEARQKAQEEEEDASSVYEAQEALRRATLDSSGKNNAQLLQLQQDLEDKQKEISEKRFEDDMDDRKQWLQDTIDAEQETYDYRLEMMTWYWEQVEVIMSQSTEYIMEFLIQWDEEYRQVSATQQEQLRQQWEFTFTQLKQITEMLDEPIINLKNNLANVTSEVQNMNIQIQALPGSWNAATSAANGYAKAANAAASAYRNLASAQNSYNNAVKASSDAAKAAANAANLGAGIVSGGGNKNNSNKNNSSGNIGSGSTKVYTPRTVAGVYNKNGKRVRAVINGQTVTIKNLNNSYVPGLGSVYQTVDGYYIKTNEWKQAIAFRYAKGGLVDFTGPAWVDGTKSKPEAFLNPYQTEQIGALADALDSRVINNMGDTSSIVTFGSINFNVASMSSPADGKKALEVFVKGANDLMAKKGIGTKINMNMR